MPGGWPRRFFSRAQGKSLHPALASRVRQSLERYPELGYAEEATSVFPRAELEVGRYTLLNVAEACLATQPEDDGCTGFQANPHRARAKAFAEKQHAAALKAAVEWAHVTAEVPPGLSPAQWQGFQGYLYRRQMKELWEEEWADQPEEREADLRIPHGYAAPTPLFLQHLDLARERQYFEYMQRMGDAAYSRPNNRILPLKQLFIACKGRALLPDEPGAPPPSAQKFNHFLARAYFAHAPAGPRRELARRYPNENWKGDRALLARAERRAEQFDARLGAAAEPVETPRVRVVTLGRRGRG